MSDWCTIGLVITYEITSVTETKNMTRLGEYVVLRISVFGESRASKYLRIAKPISLWSLLTMKYRNLTELVQI